MEHKVSLAAQENESAQALNAEREEQTALAKTRAVALAEADARTAKADERAVEGASAAWEAAVAKQRQFVGEHEAEHARALQAAEQTAKARRRDLRDAYAMEWGGLEARLQAEASAALRRGLRKATAATAAREAAEKVSAETATAKASEARVVHRA